MNTEYCKFSKQFNHALIKAEMISEMAIEDGWKSLDECMRQNPEVLDVFMRHANAALRAIERMEQTGR